MRDARVAPDQAVQCTGAAVAEDDTRPAGEHHMVGERARDVLLAGETHASVRLYEALRDGRFVVLTPPDGDVPLDDVVITQATVV